MSDHAITRADQEGELYVLSCKCGSAIHGVDETQARERFALHHRSPDAAAGLAAARDALNKKQGD